MTVVLEAMALGAPGRERQHRIETVESLDGVVYRELCVILPNW
jgi:hypothetical protein